MCERVRITPHRHEMEAENGTITIKITGTPSGANIAYDADGFSDELTAKLSAALSD